MNSSPKAICNTVQSRKHLDKSSLDFGTQLPTAQTEGLDEPWSPVAFLSSTIWFYSLQPLVWKVKVVLQPASKSSSCLTPRDSRQKGKRAAPPGTPCVSGARPLAKPAVHRAGQTWCDPPSTPLTFKGCFTRPCSCSLRIAAPSCQHSTEEIQLNLIHRLDLMSG